VSEYGHVSPEVARTALALHEALSTLTAPISADDLVAVLRRDFPEIAIADRNDLMAFLSLLHSGDLVVATTDHDSGALVYAYRAPRR
jgi:hypothetical protein